MAGTTNEAEGQVHQSPILEHCQEAEILPPAAVSVEKLPPLLFRMKTKSNPTVSHQLKLVGVVSCQLGWVLTKTAKGITEGIFLAYPVCPPASSKIMQFSDQNVCLYSTILLFLLGLESRVFIGVSGKHSKFQPVTS